MAKRLVKARFSSICYVMTLLCFLVPNVMCEEFPHYLSEVCRKKSTCGGVNTTINDKTCHCDQLCHVLEDCCEDAVTYSGHDIHLNKSQFRCVDLEGFSKLPGGIGVSMVTTCPESWTHEGVRGLCHEPSNNISHLLGRPLSQAIPGTDQIITYRNMYCAQCNGAYDAEFWEKDKEQYRTCHLHQVINVCPDTTSTNLTKYCTTGPVNYAFDRTYNFRRTIYRNGYCALCNNVKNESISCEFAIGTGTPSKPYFYTSLILSSCAANELYDADSGQCHRIVCAPPASIINRRCTNKLTAPKDNVTEPERTCEWVYVSGEYELRNDSDGKVRLYHILTDKYYDASLIRRNGSHIQVCLSIPPEDVVLFYISTIGITISIISLLVTVVVYCVNRKQLMNKPGKITVSFITSLALAQGLFLLASQFESIQYLCVTVAVLTHFFFLSSFCWTNVLLFDLRMTFSNGKHIFNKLWCYYIYSLGMPGVLVAIGLTMQYTVPNLSPNYGQTKCWICSKTGLAAYFLIPLGVFTVVNIITFVLTASQILKLSRQGSFARRNKDNRCLLLIFLKISLSIGVTWVFGFVAHGTPDQPVFTYLFTIFNTLHGFFVAVCFLCTKNVRRSVKCKSKHQVDSRPSTSTSLYSFAKRSFGRKVSRRQTPR